MLTFIVTVFKCQILIGRLWKIGGKIDRNKQIFSRKPEQSIVIKGEVWDKQMYIHWGSKYP